jgi:hypothetical protein
VITTLKSRASCVLAVVCEVAACPEERRLADFGDLTFEDLARKGVDSDVGRLAFAHVRDVGLVDFHFVGGHAHVRDGHQLAARRALNSGDDVFAHTDGDVADDAVDRRDVSGLAQDILSVREHGAGLVQVEFGLLAPGARLFDLRFGGIQGSAGAVKGRMVGVILLLGDQRFLEKLLAASPVEFGFLEIGLALR